MSPELHTPHIVFRFTNPQGRTYRPEFVDSKHILIRSTNWAKHYFNELPFAGLTSYRTKLLYDDYVVRRLTALRTPQRNELC